MSRILVILGSTSLVLIAMSLAFSSSHLDLQNISAALLINSLLTLWLVARTMDE